MDLEPGVLDGKQLDGLVVGINGQIALKLLCHTVFVHKCRYICVCCMYVPMCPVAGICMYLFGILTVLHLSFIHIEYSIYIYIYFFFNLCFYLFIYLYSIRTHTYMSICACVDPR